MAPGGSPPIDLWDLGPAGAVGRRPADSGSARLSYNAATVLGISLLHGPCRFARAFTLNGRAFCANGDRDLGRFSDRPAADMNFLDQDERLFDDEHLLHHRNDRHIAFEADR